MRRFSRGLGVRLGSEDEARVFSGIGYGVAWANSHLERAHSRDGEVVRGRDLS